MNLTEKMLESLPGNPLENLRRVDQLWQSYRDNSLPMAAMIQERQDGLESVDWDVVICGGTLGILLGAALAQQGWRVAVLERGVLRGREQEWNISRKELQVLTTLGLLSPQELEAAIATEYNPARIAFYQGAEVWVNDVLNIGVAPVYLLDTLKARFLAAGGQVFEQTAFAGAIVHPNGVQVQAGQGFHTRLLLDMMGHFSPIARQARQGSRPDAVCLVVGTCAQGFPENRTGDLFVSVTSLQNQCQYFWEAFPARDGRTTYLFTYLDTDPRRPSLEALFEDYWQLLPTYQGITLDQLQVQRALFGFFPCYRQSPLRSPWNRILFAGDSSGSQSPLSFGGFGALIRHLPRLVQGIHTALQIDLLNQRALAVLQPYQPNLSVTWLFQKAMSARVEQSLEPNQINQLLSVVFQEMAQCGDPVLKPFLHDVVQFPGLFQTLARTAIAHPTLVLKILPQVGIPPLLDWMGHYTALGLYAGIYPLASQIKQWHHLVSPTSQYYWQRWLDALKYGSGNDYQ